jgi:hypothetical protein
MPSRFSSTVINAGAARQSRAARCLTLSTFEGLGSRLSRRPPPARRVVPGPGAHGRRVVQHRMYALAHPARGFAHRNSARHGAPAGERKWFDLPITQLL